MKHDALTSQHLVSFLPSFFKNKMHKLSKTKKTEEKKNIGCSNGEQTLDDDRTETALRTKPSAAQLYPRAYYLYYTCRLRITGEALREFWGPATRLHFQDLPGALHTIGINTDRTGQNLADTCHRHYQRTLFVYSSCWLAGALVRV
jgi:hypothetical protein